MVSTETLLSYPDWKIPFTVHTDASEGIMDLRRPNTTIEAQALVGVVHYYRDMWTRWSHILALL